MKLLSFFQARIGILFTQSANHVIDTRNRKSVVRFYNSHARIKHLSGISIEYDLWESTPQPENKSFTRTNLQRYVTILQNEILLNIHHNIISLRLYYSCKIARVNIVLCIWTFNCIWSWLGVFSLRLLNVWS